MHVFIVRLYALHTPQCVIGMREYICATLTGLQTECELCGCYESYTAMWQFMCAPLHILLVRGVDSLGNMGMRGWNGR